MPRCKKPRVSVSATEIPPTLAAVLEEHAGSLVLLRGQTRRMLGDGDCLYHSLSCGLNKILKRSEWTAHGMRLHLAHWVAEHPDEGGGEAKIGGIQKRERTAESDWKRNGGW